MFETPNDLVFVPVEQEDQRFWYMDVSKAEKELGFHMMYNLEQMTLDIRNEAMYQKKAD